MNNIAYNTNKTFLSFDYGTTASQRESDWRKEYGTGKTLKAGTTLTNMKCPGCGKEKLWSAGYTEDEAFWVSNCWSCKERFTHYKEFPHRYEKDFHQAFSNKNPGIIFEDLDPEEQAKHYLASRGIPVESIRPGVARVENNIVYFQDSTGFYLNGRRIAPKPGEDKSHNKSGSETGKKYFKASTEYLKGEIVYVAEAPLKAMALHAMGLQAIAVYSSHINKENALFDDFREFNLRGAFDNDDAGVDALKDFIQILIDRGKLTDNETKHEGHLLSDEPGEDWDDYLKIKGAPAEIEEIKNRWNENAYIELAKNAEEWAGRMHKKNRYVPPVFIRDGATYGATVKVKEINGETKGEIDVYKFCDAVVSLEARIIDKTDLDRESYSWALKIAAKGKTPKYVRNVGASEIKGESLETLLLKSAEVVFDADSRKWKPFAKFILGKKDVPEATRIDYAGYHLDSEYYLTPHWGVSREGQLLIPDSIGSYKLKEQKRNIIPLGTSLFESPPKDLKTAEDRKELARVLVELFCHAYPMDGGLVLTYAIASLFSPLYKESGAGFPFFGLLGEPGSGKTDRARMILEVFGMQSEGVSLQSANKKGWLRELSHLSGGLYFMDESNDEDKGSFRDKISEFEEKAKSYYKKTTTQTQGARDNGNSIHKNYFRSSFFFAYNNSPWRTEAMRERTIEIRVRKEHLEIEGAGDAFRTWRDKTERQDRVLAGIGILEAVLPSVHANWRKERDKAQGELREHFSDARVTEDMALLLAVNRIVREELNIQSDAFNLEVSSPETGADSKIHHTIKRHLAKVKRSNSSAVMTLINALVEIGVVDLEKDNLKGKEEDEGRHFAKWKVDQASGHEGVFVYLVGMTNDTEKFPTLAKEKEKIESELKRVSGVTWRGKSDMNTKLQGAGSPKKISATGYFIPLEALRGIAITEED